MTEYIYHNGIAYAKNEDVRKIEKTQKKKTNIEHAKAFALLQAAVCAFILIVFLLFKAFGGKLYQSAADFYKEHMYSSIIAREEISETLSKLFDSP